MQKQISVILILAFSLSLIASVALGYADCESKCCCLAVQQGHGHVMHPAGAAKKQSFLKAANCCSNTMATPCKFTRGAIERLPETIPATLRSEVPEFSGTGMEIINLFIASSQPKIYVRGPDPWLKTKPLPIYLQNLTFLS